MATRLDIIKCPKCDHEIPITEALNSQIAARTRQEMTAELSAREAASEQRMQAMLTEERTKAKAQATADAKQVVGAELAALTERTETMAAALRTAQTAELEQRKRANALAEREASLELEIARKVDEARSTIGSEMAKRLEDEYRLKDAAKEKRLTDALDQITVLQRKIEQGSQQLQGEVLELEIENLLRSTFPLDDIQPVPKGVTGADVMHNVVSQGGHPCGSIIWELKRTKVFQDGWLSKLKADQRTAKAEIAILITTAMPDGVTAFEYMEGVWVTSVDHAMPLACAMRQQLTELARLRASQVGKKDKMEIMYEYLSGSGFRQRIAAIVEAFVEMQTELQEERRVCERRWAKREKQIAQVINNTSGMYGDLQGMIGSALPDIKQLEHK